MMKGNAKAYDRKTYEFSMSRALAILDGFRTAAQPRRTAA
jgi:hypothetical protein